ncbi:MAG: hypothetical protein IJX14_03220 [Clostridia bacterium]|nr:hypothetical protein [Clostridia bacterium]
MKKQLRKEWLLLSGHTSRIILLISLALLGGILLWVHGTMAPWVFHTTVMPSFAPGFTICFLLWLIVYGLAGLETGILLTPAIFCSREGLRVSAMSGFAYFLTLAWYPLFFSVMHVFLSILALLAALGVHIILLFAFLRRIKLLAGAYFLSSLLESYFLCVTIAFMLLN